MSICRIIRIASTACLAGVLAACGGGGGGSGADPAAAASAPLPAVATQKVIVGYNPYEDVDFSGHARLLGQHHDHAGVTQSRLLAYDAAGYNVLGLQDYSGNPRFSYAWTQRRWPPDKWLPKAFMAQLKNIELFLPNAEEVGIPEFHATSSFARTYIESAPDTDQPREAWQYKTNTEMLQLIRAGGGVPCLAHPFEPLVDTNYFAKIPCVEVYSAYAEAMKDQGVAFYTSRDRRRVMLDNWDRLLRENPRVLGIAVNDHFGPDTPPFQKISPRTVDSGKVQVFVHEATLQAYENAFRRGAFFAIVDQGEAKGAFPFVRDIVVEREGIYIDTDATVQWITNFGPVAQGNLLALDTLPERTTYARAEISNSAGTVYTQAFTIVAIRDAPDDDVKDADPWGCRSPAAIAVESGDKKPVCSYE